MSNPAWDWEHVAMLCFLRRDFTDIFIFKSPSAEYQQGDCWWIDKCETSCCGWGWQGTCVCPGLCHKEHMGNARFSWAESRAAALGWWLVDRGSLLPARLILESVIPSGAMGAWQIWLQKYRAYGKGITINLIYGEQFWHEFLDFGADTFFPLTIFDIPSGESV